MTVSGDKYRINNWIRYWRHEKNKAALLVEDLKLGIEAGDDVEVLKGGIRYFNYQISKYDAKIKELEKELEEI